MRKILIAAVFMAAMLFDLRPAPAYEAGEANGINSPWCAVISLGTGSAYWDCRYQTFAQCVPNVLAGNRGFCNQNPYYNGWNGGPVAAAPHAKKRQVRRY
jgi:hypothetical protein